jgi:hypothetical protein
VEFSETASFALKHFVSSLILAYQDRANVPVLESDLDLYNMTPVSQSSLWTSGDFEYDPIFDDVEGFYGWSDDEEDFEYDFDIENFSSDVFEDYLQHDLPVCETMFSCGKRASSQKKKVKKVTEYLEAKIELAKVLKHNEFIVVHNCGDRCPHYCFRETIYFEYGIPISPSSVSSELFLNLSRVSQKDFSYNVSTRIPTFGSCDVSTFRVFVKDVILSYCFSRGPPWLYNNLQLYQIRLSDVDRLVNFIYRCINDETFYPDDFFSKFMVENGLEYGWFRDDRFNSVLHDFEFFSRLQRAAIHFSDPNFSTSPLKILRLFTLGMEYTLLTLYEAMSGFSDRPTVKVIGYYLSEFVNYGILEKDGSRFRLLREPD